MTDSHSSDTTQDAAVAELLAAQPSWEQITQDLVEILTLEPIEANLFRGISRDLVGRRVFGGQVLGQALMAASLTTDRPAHSMHAYFIKGGDINAPIIYQVERLRDGRSFSNRFVRALQHGETIFTAMLSFAPFEAGLEYQREMPDWPPVDQIDHEEVFKAQLAPLLPEKIKANIMRRRHIEMRPINPHNFIMPQAEVPHRAHYMRAGAALPDDERMHQAVLAFASDYILMTVTLMPHAIGYRTTNLQAASLDHTIYFHHPFKADEWLLHDMTSAVTAQARGLSQGTVWQNGRLVATTMQEALMRLRDTEVENV